MSLEYGYVVVTKGKHKGRIGIYDDDASDKRAIVYFGDSLLTNKYYIINHSYLDNSISSNQLMNRADYLCSLIFHSDGSGNAYELLLEYELCHDIMNERFIKIMYVTPKNSENCQIFISYSTENMRFAKLLAADLCDAGLPVFLADNSIELGENIISRISESLGKTVVFIPIISEQYLKSVFCRDEWTSFYISFEKTNPDSIYPVIIDSSDPPTLLKSIKYIRYGLMTSYEDILEAILKSIRKKLSKEESQEKKKESGEE